MPRGHATRALKARLPLLDFPDAGARISRRTAAPQPRLDMGRGERGTDGERVEEDVEDAAPPGKLEPARVTLGEIEARRAEAADEGGGGRANHAGEALRRHDLGHDHDPAARRHGSEGRPGGRRRWALPCHAARQCCGQQRVSHAFRGDGGHGDGMQGRPCGVNERACARTQKLGAGSEGG